MVTDLDDEAPTDIQINDAVFIDGYVSLADDKGANFLIGTLTAICPTGKKKISPASIGSKINHFICIFWRRNISCSNGKLRSGGANEHATKPITVTVTDLDDEAPTDIQINDAAFIDDKVVFTNDKGDW
jgi:hypothetical protein